MKINFYRPFRVQGIWCNWAAPNNWLISFRNCAISRVQTGLRGWHARQGITDTSMNQSWWEWQPMLCRPQKTVSILTTHTLFVRSLCQHWVGWGDGLANFRFGLLRVVSAQMIFEHEEIQRFASLCPLYVPMDLFMHLFTRPPCLKSSNCFSSRLLQLSIHLLPRSHVYIQPRFLFLHREMMKHKSSCLSPLGDTTEKISFSHSCGLNAAASFG